MGHFFEWGNYRSPSNLEMEALKNAAFKSGLTHVEIIDDKKAIKYISENFNTLYIWALENLEGGWTVINDKHNKVLFFYFSSEEDQMGFKLVWV